MNVASPSSAVCGRCVVFTSVRKGPFPISKCLSKFHSGKRKMDMKYVSVLEWVACLHLMKSNGWDSSGDGGQKCLLLSLN